MGQEFNIKCTACDYSVSVQLGIGMMYSPHAVFYGFCNDNTQNWSVAFPDGLCELGKPLLNDLIKNKRIKEKAFSLLKNRAIADDNYGHELYICSKCQRLYNRFYFHLIDKEGEYEPEYKCSYCRVLLKKVELKEDKGILKVFYNNNYAVWKCPKCGNDELAYGDLMILWD